MLPRRRPIPLHYVCAQCLRRDTAASDALNAVLEFGYAVECAVLRTTSIAEDESHKNIALTNFWYQQGGSLGSILCDVVDFYERDREQAWSDDPAAVRLLAFIDSAAGDFLNAAGDLSVAGELAKRWDAAQEIVSYLELSPDVREKVQILVARRSCGRIDEMADRCLDITELLIRGHPSEVVSRYMRRLGRCYISGFLPECVILCRSVLESAVVDACRAEGIIVDKPSMNARLDTLRDRQRMTNEARDMARTVWARGNTAVHKDPDLVVQVRETLVMTLSVLTELYPAPGPAP